MDVLGLLGLFASAKGTYDQSRSVRDAYQQQAETARQNQVLAEMQAKDALARGVTTQQGHQRQVRQLKGQQIASMAARGLDLSEGTAADMLASTDIMAAHDQQTIADNAEQEAWGFRMMGENYQANASLLNNRASAESPILAGLTSLLTQARTVSPKWYGQSQ